MLFKSAILVCLMVIITWPARLSAFSTQRNEEVSFDRSSYITYELSSTKITAQDHILLLFRTIKPSGLLLHAGGENGDFMTLELVSGKLRYSYNLGSVGNISGFHEHYLGNHLADNEWHQVDVTRQGKNHLIKLDVTKKPIVGMMGKYDTLELDHKIYVAGVDQEGARRAKHLYNRKLPFSKFEGCLVDVTLNRQNFATLAKKRDPYTSIHGNVTFGCHMTIYSPLTFKTPRSYIIVSIAPYSNVLTFSFKIRTYESEGMLIMHKDREQNGADISLRHVNGGLQLQVTFAASSKQITLLAGNSLNDGAWHPVSVSVSGRKIRLQVDDESSEKKLSPAFRFTNGLQIAIGSDRADVVGFVGCMYDIVTQGREVNASRETSSRISIGNCSLNDHCLPDPCKNGGRCLQRVDKSVCDCSKTHFSGKYCEIPVVAGRETCADWKAAGATNDGQYIISPNNVKPFAVYCKMRNLKDPITVISHVLAGKQITAVNPRTRKAGFYFHPVNYSVGLASVLALISTSTHCRQHLTYNCFNSVLFDSSHDFDLNQGRGARWISRAGKTMDYWAGASPGSQKCACGILNTCVRPDLKCNCDKWDAVWRKDAGYITDLDVLPVKSVKFSVRGTSLTSNFILGSLECFGRKVSQTTSKPSTLASSSSSLSYSTSSYERSTNKVSDNTSISTAPTTFSNAINFTTNKPELPTYGPPIDKPPVIIIDSERKFITIKQNSNQELILIILSVILAVFIIIILILMIRQNLFLPCKCADGPIYRDVSNVDSIELGPPSSLFTNVDTEIVEYEASPYPLRGMDGVVTNSSGRDVSSCRIIHVNVLEPGSNDENDRLHLSGGSSPSNSDDKEEWEKKQFENSEYDEFGSLEMVLLKSPQEMIEVEVEKLKEALYEVISASEVNINNNPISKETKEVNISNSPVTKETKEVNINNSPITKETKEANINNSPITKETEEVNINNNPITKETKMEDIPCSVVHEDEHFNNTSTISSCGMEFSRPSSYQDIERASSSEQELGSDSTHAQSTRSSDASCSWDSGSNPDHHDKITDYGPNYISSNLRYFPINDDFRICTKDPSIFDVASNEDVDKSPSNDHSASLSNGPLNIDINMVPLNEETKNCSKDRAESEPLLMENLPSSTSSLNGILDLNQIANSNCSTNKEDSHNIDDLRAYAQLHSAKNANAEQKDSGSSESVRHETSL